MYITNASGCSSAFGGSTPSTPYTVDKKGRGPTWAMSLFEDNAEYAYGFLLGDRAIKKQLKTRVLFLKSLGIAVEESEDYLAKKNDFKLSDKASENLLSELLRLKNSSEYNDENVKEAADFILGNKEYLTKKTFWAFGGDGWAYDIGYGGLDHVIASGLDINMLVLDTEVYSNTGGQASKATFTGAIAKFSAAGKETSKKDLGVMAMSYGYVYVAQIAMGANGVQALKAIREAEAYPGPSLIIAYCPCIEHGIKIGMGKSQHHMKEAVEAGYWHLYRFNPALKDEGKNPFILDSMPPQGDLKNFMRGETRYSSLENTYPGRAEFLFKKATLDAKKRFELYDKLSKE
jgi:pyruvate-ferredoxin/flavodoxin oxidoreductase